MKSNLVWLAVAVLLLSVPMLSAQETNEFVDVKQTNKRIAHLQTENENHKTTIAANRERKAFLEDRIRSSEARLKKIAESLGYARETNLELNALTSETRDRETKQRLYESRSELMSVIWILTNEEIHLTEQAASDKKEIEFLSRDTARRETLVEKNDDEIAGRQKAVAYTESKINEISSKIDAVINKLDGLREEVTVKM